MFFDIQDIFKVATYPWVKLKIYSIYQDSEIIYLKLTVYLDSGLSL